MLSQNKLFMTITDGNVSKPILESFKKEKIPIIFLSELQKITKSKSNKSDKFIRRTIFYQKTPDFSDYIEQKVKSLLPNSKIVKIITLLLHSQTFFGAYLSYLMLGKDEIWKNLLLVLKEQKLEDLSNFKVLDKVNEYTNSGN